MAEKLSVLIELDGGDEIARQLGDIGKAGTKAFQDIGRAAEKVGGFDQLDPADVTAKLVKMGITGTEAINKIQTAVKQAGRLEQVVAGVQKLENGFDKLGLSVDKFANRMAGSLGPLGVFARGLGPLGVALGVAGAAFIKFGNDSADALGQLTTQAAKLGLTAQQFDQIQKAFGKVGVSADAVAGNLENLKGLLGGGLMRLGDIAPPEVTAGLVQFIGQLEKMPDGVARTQLAMQTLGDTLGGQVIAGLQTGSISAQTFAAALATVTPATQQQIADANRYNQALTGLDNAWTQFKAEVAAPIGIPVLEWLTSQLPGIQAGIATTVREFQALWSVINTIGSTGAQVIGGLVEIVNTLGRAVAWTAEQFLKLVGLGPQAGGAAPAAAPGMAGGGLLGGSGTGTSDSNLAWVSRGEHIMPARAVAQPGVLAFLEALRRSGGNLSRVLDGMGRFALGGMVPRAIPAFAAGGLAGGGNHVTIQFPGLPAIGGLRASSDVVDQLQRAAALAQVRSGGRKPSRYS